MADSSARLTILNGPLAGKELVLEEVVDNILIGSDGACRFHLPSPGISPIHARIWMDAAGVTVYDTHSPRGLYVNDDRVNGQAPLRNGDVLWLGTPGEEEAIMVQVRLPPRPGAAAAEEAPAVVEAEPEDVTDRTVAMVAPTLAPPEPEPEAVEVVEETTHTVSMPAPSLDQFAIAEPAPEAGDAESTMVMAVSPDLEPVAEAEPEPESDSTVVDFRPVAVEPTQAFYVAEPAAPVEEPPAFEETYALAPEPDEPVKFAVEIPPAPPAAPPSFEDETAESTHVMEAPTAPPPEEPEPPPPPPPPVVARPPAPPPPAPRPPRPAPAPAVEPPPRPAAPSSAGKYAAFGAIGFLVLAGGGFAAWRMLRSSTTAPPPTVETPPTTMAAADPVQVAPPVVTAPPETLPPAPEPVPEPPVEEAVTIVKSPPPTLAAGAAKPGVTTPPTKATVAPAPTTLSPEVARAQQAATQVTALLSRADSLAAARDFAGAASAYDEVLKLDPSNARAGEAKATALAAAASLKRAFVAGRTTVISGKAAKGGVSGFDSEDVSVAKAPDYSGRIDFEASPRNVKAGDNYTILAYLTNDGKKPFKIQAATVSTVVNGARSAVPVSPKDKDLDPQQRVLLAELPGTWQADTKTWSAEVSVTSNRNDTFKSALTWR